MPKCKAARIQKLKYEYQLGIPLTIVFLPPSHWAYFWTWQFHLNSTFLSDNPSFTHSTLWLPDQPAQQPCTDLITSNLTLKMTRNDQNLVAACFVSNDDFAPASSLPQACEDTILCDQTQTVYVYCELNSLLKYTCLHIWKNTGSCQFSGNFGGPQIIGMFCLWITDYNTIYREGDAVCCFRSQQAWILLRRRFFICKNLEKYRCF